MYLNNLYRSTVKIKILITCYKFSVAKMLCNYFTFVICYFRNDSLYIEYIIPIRVYLTNACVLILFFNDFWMKFRKINEKYGILKLKKSVLLKYDAGNPTVSRIPTSETFVSLRVLWVLEVY